MCYNCNNIVELLEDIGKLINLVEIEVRLFQSSRLTRHYRIGKLTNVKRLVIGQSGLWVVLNSVGELSKVEYLSFEGWKQMTAIHDTKMKYW